MFEVIRPGDIGFPKTTKSWMVMPLGIPNLMIILQFIHDSLLNLLCVQLFMLPDIRMTFLMLLCLPCFLLYALLCILFLRFTHACHVYTYTLCMCLCFIFYDLYTLLFVSAPLNFDTISIRSGRVWI